MASVTLESAFQAAWELAQTGTRKVSVKFALWIGAMSAQQALDKNGALARILATFVNIPLPSDPDELVEVLGLAEGNINGNHLNALYHAEKLEREGKLTGLENIGADYLAQVAWRKHLYNLFHDAEGAHGMAWKTISMAALVIDPMNCELVPVDRHVMARFNLVTRNGTRKQTPQREGPYMAVEQLVAQERAQYGAHLVPLAIWHWFKWEQWRQLMGDAVDSEAAESHAELSPRWY